MSGMKEKIKEHLKDVATLKGSSQSIAFGFALGTFIAISPTFGLGPFIGLFLVLIFKKISKLSLFASFVIWNPLILFLLYPVGYGIGNAVLADSAISIYSYKLTILNQIFAYSQKFFVGSIMLAVVVSIASYFMIFLFVEEYKRKRVKKDLKTSKYSN